MWNSHYVINGSSFIDFINTIFCIPTFPKSFSSGDPLLDDHRWGDPLFDRDAKFLIKLKGEPDLRRLGDSVDDDLFMAMGVTWLPSAVIFSFSMFCLSNIHCNLKCYLDLLQAKFDEKSPIQLCSLRIMRICVNSLVSQSLGK